MIVFYTIGLSLGQITNKSRSSLSNVIAVFQNIGPKMCEQRCSQYYDCEAITLKRKSLYCELVKDIASAQYVEDDNFLFSTVETITLVSSVHYEK